MKQQSHPDVRDLALLAGGELPFWKKWHVRRHVRECADCEAEFEAMSHTRAGFARSAGELPAGLDWDRLEFEMRANIRVGLAAGDAIRPQVAPARWDWRAGFAVAALATVVVTGWMLGRQNRVNNSPVASVQAGYAMAQSGREGIELKQQSGAVLTLMAPATRPVSYSVDTEGALSARSVDEAGQITISHVQVD